MRNLMALLCAATIGGAIGGLLADRTRASSAGFEAKVEAREFVLVDEANRQVARLESTNGRSQLVFLSNDASPALIVGVDARENARFLRMFGKNGQMVATLNSRSANGESTLTLGDERKTVRIALGALPSDMYQGAESIDDWGLELRSLETLWPVFSVHSLPKEKAKSPAAFLRIVKPDGTVWNK
jgi:hypothetical protein